MRVDQRNLTGTAGAEANRAHESQSIGRDGRPGLTGSRSSSGADNVDLSALSRALSSQETTRANRMGELASLYRAGKLQVEPAQVSRSMVSDALAAPKL